MGRRGRGQRWEWTCCLSACFVPSDEHGTGGYCSTAWTDGTTDPAAGGRLARRQYGPASGADPPRPRCVARQLRMSAMPVPMGPPGPAGPSVDRGEQGSKGVICAGAQGVLIGEVAVVADMHEVFRDRQPSAEGTRQKATPSAFCWAGRRRARACWSRCVAWVAHRRRAGGAAWREPEPRILARVRQRGHCDWLAAYGCDRGPPPVSGLID